MRTVGELLHHYQHVIDDLTVVTGSKGVFDVEMDGELLFSKRAVGRHAEPGEVLERLRAALGPGVPEFER